MVRQYVCRFRKVACNVWKAGKSTYSCTTNETLFLAKLLKKSTEILTLRRHSLCPCHRDRQHATAVMPKHRIAFSLETQSFRKLSDTQTKCDTVFSLNKAELLSSSHRHRHPNCHVTPKHRTGFVSPLLKSFGSFEFLLYSIEIFQFSNGM